MAAGVLDLFSHIVGSILCAAAALIIWDVGTRSPGRVIADAIGARDCTAAVLRGMVRLIVGLVFAALSVGLLYFSLPANEFGRFKVYQIAAFLAALMVELLIGEEARAALGLRKGTRTG
ncbi:MAG: hypothetical protein M3126_06365 [Candidatus Eremiobacteraeota bacterium]|nr:hypothetical protein [Candidatus Eremiobacteraeota bacterium]